MSETEYLMKGMDPPSVDVPGKDVPTSKLDPSALKALGYNLKHLFDQYRSDRYIQELRWLRNLRQYLGYYDPEVEKELSPERSRAYPKMTRVKVISMLAHIMDLMFPSDDKNWTINARPSPDMTVEDVKQALADAQARDEAQGVKNETDLDYVMAAIQELADKRARELTTEIEDQLQELGGDQSYDYVALVQEVLLSGILYGLGLLKGPYARPVKTTEWSLDQNGQPVAKTRTAYMPHFEFLTIWEFYPDLAAKRLEESDGYFTRRVMARNQVRELADREEFFGDIIKTYLANHEIGNYRPQEFETELRSMGVKMNVNETKIETTKYEIIIWHGKVDGNELTRAGVEVPPDKRADQIEAEIWMLDGYVIKAMINPWVELGVDVRTIHAFIFDKDDTAPIGFGLPNILRDTQMSISAATRMMLDNASVICGPMLEMNTALLVANQDLTSFGAYKTFYRDDEGPTSQWPAVRELNVDGHLPELENIIELFLRISDIETFSTALTGGDTTGMPTEAMRNAAGASMLMSKASLPFKQIIRNFDRFTMSVIQSLVQFNRQFNPKKAPASEYDVIARGATSLIAKEVRGMQMDTLAQTLTPEDEIYIDRQKLLKARIRVRDLDEVLVSDQELKRRLQSKQQSDSQAAQSQQAWLESQIRLALAGAFKDITQAQKNQAGADATFVEAALHTLEGGLKEPQQAPAPAAQPPAPVPDQGAGGLPPNPAASGIPGM